MAGGRNDCAIADALQAMAQALSTLNQRLEIFQALGCPLVQKVTLDAFMLSREAGVWWQGALQRMMAAGTQVEFLELKQGEDSVVEYVTKFEDLVRFCPMYNGVGNEEDKWVKFVSGLCPEIKQVFNYQRITQYHELVKKCRVYDEETVLE
ncbi:uncharacterized protein LOC109791076 [Cajanus cajan]|uniref:uncharacterized protein LOC109791076 n=1 Tax=Cajanus cajan TaxID=3821 RepID=UPI00098DBD7C|nr:uncharacterized protein LOC109791076 [Cajanus cajan]